MSDLFYEIYHIDPVTEQIQELDVSQIADSKLKILLDKNCFHPASELKKSNLLIFLANHPRFSELKFFHAIIERFRTVSILNSNDETIVHSDTDFIPILTICREIPPTRKFGIQFWDSSIWQRWVSMKDSDMYFQSLDEMLSEIRLAYELGTYNQYVAKEFCEFSTRVYKNSYLMSLDCEWSRQSCCSISIFSGDKVQRLVCQTLCR